MISSPLQQYFRYTSFLMARVLPGLAISTAQSRYWTLHIGKWCRQSYQLRPDASSHYMNSKNLPKPGKPYSGISHGKTVSQHVGVTSLLKALWKLNVTVINECQTRLDTEDLGLWREAGLSIASKGFVVPSNTGSDPSENRAAMREDMICNALIWLISRLSNYIAAGKAFNPTPAGHRMDDNQADEPLTIGISQQALLARWDKLDRELTAWHSGLPETFHPCARIPASVKSNELGTSVFSEIWYSIPMCGTTIQNYHMARILLLVNKPHETTTRRSTITQRLKSYRVIQAEIMRHCHEIMYVLGFLFWFAFRHGPFNSKSLCHEFGILGHATNSYQWICFIPSRIFSTHPHGKNIASRSPQTGRH